MYFQKTIWWSVGYGGDLGNLQIFRGNPARGPAEPRIKWVENTQ